MQTPLIAHNSSSDELGSLGVQSRGLYGARPYLQEFIRVGGTATVSLSQLMDAIEDSKTSLPFHYNSMHKELPLLTGLSDHARENQ